MMFLKPEPFHATRQIGALLAIFVWNLLPLPTADADLIQHLVIPSNPSSGDVFVLPNYGNVRVTHDYATASDFTVFHQTQAENQSIGSLNWGTDTDRFNIVNRTTAFQDYSISFEFLDGAPDTSRLYLIVTGLHADSTATVSEPGVLLGELDFGTLSTTLLNGQVLSSANDGATFNTGWAIYQPSGAFTSFDIDMHQFQGDGLGWTFAYAVPEPNSSLLLLFATFFAVFSRKKRVPRAKK
jgi:hypothetical protein